MNEINIVDLLNLAYRRLWALALAFLVAASGAYGYCRFLATPKYSSTVSIMATNGAITTGTSSLGNKQTTVAATDVAASLSLVDTIIDVLKTSKIYKQTAKEYGNTYTYTDIKGMTAAKRRGDNSMIVDITITSTNEKDAVKIANIFGRQACEYVKNLIPYSKVDVVQEAETAGKVSPRTLITTAASGIVGVIILYVIFFALESMNHTIKNEEDFTSKYPISVLGKIPDFEAAENEVSRYSKGYKKYGYRKYYRKYYRNYYRNYKYGSSKYGYASKSDDDTLNSAEVKNDGKK